MAGTNGKKAKCALCGNRLPPRTKGKLGPSHQYCDVKTTGRPCARFVKRWGECHRFADAILDHSPSSTRGATRYRLRRKYGAVHRELKQVND